MDVRITHMHTRARTRIDSLIILRNLFCTKTQILTNSQNINLLKPTGYVMYQQLNIQQSYALPTPYLCDFYLSQNKQQLLPHIK
jgi:hypothetical protein